MPKKEKTPAVDPVDVADQLPEEPSPVRPVSEDESLLIDKLAKVDKLIAVCKATIDECRGANITEANELLHACQQANRSLMERKRRLESRIAEFN